MISDDPAANSDNWQNPLPGGLRSAAICAGSGLVLRVPARLWAEYLTLVEDGLSRGGESTRPLERIAHDLRKSPWRFGGRNKAPVKIICPSYQDVRTLVDEVLRPYSALISNPDEAIVARHLAAALRHLEVQHGANANEEAQAICGPNGHVHSLLSELREQGSTGSLASL